LRPARGAPLKKSAKNAENLRALSSSKPNTHAPAGPRSTRRRPLLRAARAKRGLRTGRLRALPARMELAGEQGLSLIEVVLATLMVSIIVIGTLTGFDAATGAASKERSQAQATVIAQQDEERLRGLTAAELGELGTQTRSVAQNGLCIEQVSGNWRYCEGTPFAATTYTGTVFTVTSSAQYVTASKNRYTCEVAGGSADYLQTTSTVSWTGRGAKGPVSQSSIVTNPVKASLLVRVKNQANEAVSGATVTVTGTKTSAAQTTPASGCVIFGGIEDSEVTVAVSDSGYVDHQGDSPPPSKSMKLSSLSLAETEFVIAQAGSILAQFLSNGVSTGVTSDSFVAYNSGIASPPYMHGGSDATTSGAYFSSVQLGNLFPFAEGSPLVYKKYAVWAGDCSKNNPQEVASIAAAEAAVEPGTVSTAKVEVPAVNLTLTKTSGGSQVTSTSATITNSECVGATAQNVTGSISAVHVVKITEGALEPKYQPYAKKLILCVVFKEGAKYYKNKNVELTNTKKEGTSVAKYVKVYGSYEESSSELKC
jgi:hypothetical protein